MSSSLPINLYNAGSAQAADLDFSREVLWKRMGLQIGRKAAQIPVYLVNPDQMDYLYPPRPATF